MTNNYVYLHFDSLSSNCTYNTSQTYNSYTFNSSNVITAPNSYNATFKLSNNVYHPTKIHLMSIELPISFNNIRTTSQSNIFSVYDSTNTYYSITLSDKNYTSISNLISDINAAFSLSYSSKNISLSVNNNNYVYVSSSTITTINIVYNTLAYILGFRNALDVKSTNNTLASCMYNLNIDNYINFIITNIPSISNTNSSGLSCSFKIPVNSINGVVYYTSYSTSFPQSVIVSNPMSIVLNQLSFSITDRFGYSLNSLGLDYSVSLVIEYN